MSTNSKIQWTTNTFNPWWGCTKVSDGCKNCYADTFSHRLGLNIWGPKAERRFFADKHWNEPVRWNHEAGKSGERQRVFCASMADIGEDRRDLDQPRERLMRIIESTPNLDWQLLTKRPENLCRLFAWTSWPPNVWAGTSVENQQCADERIPHLLKCPAVVRFLSCEPLLQPVDWLKAVAHAIFPGVTINCSIKAARNTGIHWVIVGGESGAKSRRCDIAWIRSIIRQCKAAGVACFVKQLGANPSATLNECNIDEWDKDNIGRLELEDPKGGNPDEWPSDLRVREMPNGGAK